MSEAKEIVRVEPGLLQGTVSAPPSKSHGHRLLTAAALCGEGEKTTVLSPGENADIQATLRCLRALGAGAERTGSGWRITGRTAADGGAELDCGESGSTLRFLLPLCALGEGERLLTGQGRLPQRPNGPLLEVLRKNGAVIEGELLPLRIRGGLRSGDFALEGNVSSQYFTGLLLALPLLEGDSTLRTLSPLESAPYVNLTLETLKTFGIRTERIRDGWRIPGGQRYRSPGTAETEGDWSAAAFFLGADFLGSRVTVTGLKEDSVQGDRAMKELLGRIGESMDVRDTPDLMPMLAAAAAAVPGAVTRIRGAGRLRLKESDRLAAMRRAIEALGGRAEEEPDGLVVYGTALRGGTVDGQNDHRIVMSAAVAATVCREPVTIVGAEAVRKSYPDFWKDFEKLGGKVNV